MSGVAERALDEALLRTKSLLRAKRADDDGSFQWTPLVISGVVVGSLFVMALLWIVYRYVIWVPRKKAAAARKEGTAVSGSESDETRRLISAIKAR
jgi:hypothetical protein